MTGANNVDQRINSLLLFKKIVAMT